MDAACWSALRALASAKYTGHTPSLPAEHIVDLVKHGFAVRAAGVLTITDTGESALVAWHHFLAGRYRTKRDGGMEYTYLVDWIVAEQLIRWNASVHRSGDLAGTPCGEYRGAPPDLPAAVRGFVEGAIEKRTGVA